MFSDNEGIEELPTESIKFFMLPYLLGSVTMRRKCKPMASPTDTGSAVDLPERSLLMKLSKAYYRDFILRCKDYGVTAVQLPEENDEQNSAGAATSINGKPTPQVK